MKRSVIVFLMCGLIACVARAAYLESDAGDRSGPSVPEPPPRILPPEADSPLIRLVRRMRVGEPFSRRGLTFFPLLLPDREVFDWDVLTLDEALNRDMLLIRETGGGEVPRVRVRNDATRPVFLMAGEIIVGGKQNRIIRNDILLPARSDFVEVPVYCGEQDRWSDDDAAFKSGGLSAPSLRKMAADVAPQGHIWREIEGQLGRAELRSSTRNYQQIYEDAGTRRRLDECVSDFRGFCRGDTVGCVAVSRGRIIGCDIFTDRGLFARLWDKICRSYAAEEIVVYRGNRREWTQRHAVPDDRAVRRFLDTILAAGFSEVSTPGIGRYRRISGAVSGHVLEFRGSVLHAGVFPARLPIEPLERGGITE